VVITGTCLLIFSPLPNNPSHGVLEFWATLQSLERIRRNMNNPNIVALQWRTLEEGQQQCVTVMKVGESKQQVEAFL